MAYEGLLLIVVALALAGFYFWSRSRFTRLTALRRSHGNNLERFRAELDGAAPPLILGTVYEYFSGSTPTRMPVLASDRLAELFGMVDDDIPDEMNELADKCGVPRPTTEEAYHVATVADAVTLMEKLRQRAAAAELGGKPLEK